MTAIAVVLESRLADLAAKGVLGAADEIYNPARAFRRVVLFSPYPEDLALGPAMDARGIDVVCHGGRVRRPWSLPSAILRMAREIRSRDVAVVRGSNSFHGSLMGALAARIAGVPSVAWLGGDNRIAQTATGRWYYGSRTLTNLIERVTLASLDAILVPNRFTRDYVIAVAGERAARKITVIPWPAERVPEHEPDEPDLAMLGLSPADVVVPVIGFVNRYKFSDVLFEALSAGPLEAPNGPVRIVFCGDGDLRGEGERRFAKRDDVLFTGFRPRPVVRALIRRARAVCIPMSGMVLLETASIGRPVVSSAVEWHSEVIKDGETGLLVDPRDPAAWRGALSRLLADPAEASRMAVNLRARYERDYAIEVVTARTAAFYRGLAR